MLFQKLKIVIYLRQNSLELHEIDSVETQKLIFSKSVYKNGEVIDMEKFKDEIIEFLIKLSMIPQDSVIILADGVFFQKSFHLISDFNEKIKHFHKEINIPKNDLAEKIIKTKNTVYCLATNKSIYELVMYVFQEQGWIIEGVVPVTLYVDGDSDVEIGNEQVKHIIGDTLRLHIGNFLDNNIKNKKINLPWKKLIVVLLSISLIIGGLFVFTYYSTLITTENKIVPSVAVIPMATPIPEISKKEDISIKVINGTGIVGQAGKVKALLIKEGFIKIETSNSDIRDTTETVIIYNKPVTKQIKAAISKDLGEVFEKIIEKNEKATDTTIEIITGDYLK